MGYLKLVLFALPVFFVPLSLPAPLPFLFVLFVLATACVACACVLRLRSLPRLQVVWDLDMTLIHSTHITTHADPSLRTTIIGHGPNWLTHIDDDLMEFQTHARPCARVVLLLCSLFTDQHVFTAASRGYMENCLAWLDPHGQQTAARTESQGPSSASPPKPLFRVRMSATEVPKPDRKNLRLLNLPHDHMRRAVLVEDNVKYCVHQPHNCIIVRRFKRPAKPRDAKGVCGDLDLWYVLWTLFWLALSGDVRPHLPLNWQATPVGKHKTSHTDK